MGKGDQRRRCRGVLPQEPRLDGVRQRWLRKAGKVTLKVPLCVEDEDDWTSSLCLAAFLPLYIFCSVLFLLSVSSFKYNQSHQRRRRPVPRPFGFDLQVVHAAIVRERKLNGSPEVIGGMYYCMNKQCALCMRVYVLSFCQLPRLAICMWRELALNSL